MNPVPENYPGGRTCVRVVSLFMKKLKFIYVALLLLCVSCNNEIITNEYNNDSIYGFWLQDTAYNQYAVDKSNYYIEFNKETSTHSIYDYYESGYYMKIDDMHFEFLSESIIVLGVIPATYAINSNTLAIVSNSSSDYYKRLFFWTNAPKIMPSTKNRVYIRINMSDRDKQLVPHGSYKIFVTTQDIIF